MAVSEKEESRMAVCWDGVPIYDIVLEDTFGRLPEEVKRLKLWEKALHRHGFQCGSPVSGGGKEAPFGMLQPGDVLCVSGGRGA